MATDTVSTTPGGERADLAKLAAEEISALMKASRCLSDIGLDQIQRRLVRRALLARVEELADIAWTALADGAEDVQELTSRFHKPCPIEYRS